MVFVSPPIVIVEESNITPLRLARPEVAGIDLAQTARRKDLQSVLPGLLGGACPSTVAVVDNNNLELAIPLSKSRPERPKQKGWPIFGGNKDAKQSNTSPCNCFCLAPMVINLINI